MIEDPYKVLGISKDASKDDIKKAYRQMAKKYHPDLHPDDPVAAQKMNEVNEAYDMLNNPEKYQKRAQENTHRNSYGNPYERQQGYGNYGNTQNQGSYGGYQSFGGFGFEDIIFGFGQSMQIPKPMVEPGDSADIRQAVDFINMQQYAYASQTLNGIVSAERNGRWYYLSALTNYGLKNMILAREQIRRAVQLEPGNGVYVQTLRAFDQSGTAYTATSQDFSKRAEGFEKMCMTFCALQFLCMFCGC